MAPDGTAAQAWDDVAAAWDASVDYVESHSAKAIQALIDGVAVRPGDRVLELAAGPGALGSRWSALVGEAGRVVLTDVAPRMVDAARRRNAAHSNVQTAVVDASAIDFPDESFDVVASCMGLMFVPDPAAALSEARRVLAPGGRFGALTWGAADRNPWMASVGMAAMANGISGPMPFAPGGVFSLGDPARLAELADAAGFVEVAVGEIPVAFIAPDIDSHVEQVASLAGPIAAAFKAAGLDQIEGVKRTAAELAAAHRNADGSFTLPGCALLVTGRADR